MSKFEVIGEATGPAARLARAVGLSARAIERSTAIQRVMVGAAEVDGEVRIELAHGHARRYADIQAVRSELKLMKSSVRGTIRACI